MAHPIHWLWLAASVALAGCGTIDPQALAQAAECQQSLGDDYLPFEKDIEWRYAVSDARQDVALGEKTNTILGVEGDTVKLQIGGVLRPGVRWLRFKDSRYEWLRNLYSDAETGEPSSDQHYLPAALRFDANRTSPGAKWSDEGYTKVSIDITKCPDWSESLGADNRFICPEDAVTTEVVTETWAVYAADERLSAVQARLEQDREVRGVPAGNFDVVCQQRSCEAGTCISGTYCFAKGVGKVYELSSEREELTSVCF